MSSFFSPHGYPPATPSPSSRIVSLLFGRDWPPRLLFGDEEALALLSETGAPVRGGLWQTLAEILPPSEFERVEGALRAAWGSDEAVVVSFRRSTGEPPLATLELSVAPPLEQAGFARPGALRCFDAGGGENAGEDFANALVAALSDPLVVCSEDEGLTIRFANTAAHQLLRAEGPLVGRSLVDLWGEDELVRRIRDRIRTGSGEPFLEEIERTTPGQPTAYLDVTVYRLEGERGRYRALQVRDRTARRLAASVERELQERLWHITRYVPGMVFQLLLDADGVLTIPFASEGAERVVGLLSAEVMDNAARLFDRIDPTSLPTLAQALRHSAETLTPLEVTVSIHKARAQRWIEIFALPVRDDSGAVRWSGYAQDVTARKEAEEELRFMTESAMAATQAKSEFLATLSHEIRTAMNGILGMAHLLGETPLTDEQRQYCRGITGSARALVGIVDDILDISRVEAGMMTLTSQPFDLREALEQACEALAPLAQLKGLLFVCDIDPAAARAVVGDPVRLRQIITNVAGNAIKFTETGHVAVRARWSELDGPTGTFTLEVEDTGIGIPSERLEAIFEPFIQAESIADRASTGTGLGLAITKRLVELMGGRIEVESEPGAGSVFRIALPMEGVAEAKNSRREVAYRIAVVGSSILADAHARTLRTLGYAVCRWPSVKEVPARLDENARPHGLIVTDPGDRTEWAHRIARLREAFSDRVAVLVVDREATFPSMENLPPGIDAVLPTFVRQRTLGELLARTLGRPHARAEARPTEEATPLSPLVEGLRVLLVEDDETNRLVAERMLKKLGCAVTTATNGKEAVDAWETGRFDAIFMDCQLPVLDGYEATRSIRSREAERGDHVPIIAMTAYAMKGDRERCLEAGMDDYVSKPISVESIQGALGRWIAGSAPPRQAPASREPDEIFDRRAFLERVGEDRDAACEIFAAFEGQFAASLQALRESVRAEDATHWHALCHRLAGACAAVGAIRLARRVRALEQEVGSRSWADLDEQLRALTDEFEAFRHEACRQAA